MRKRKAAAAIWFFLLFILILDGKNTISGALKGIEICLYTVIPSLFPFFVITGMLTSTLSGLHIPGAGWISKVCKIPKGAESLFILGLLGGYPMGAGAINNYYRQGLLDKQTANRMLGFCNNCGPSFIFGICVSFFPGLEYGWLLWGIQIISAILTGAFLPTATGKALTQLKEKKIAIDRTLKNSVHAIASICGWIVLFRVLITMQSRWILWRLPSSLQPFIIGLQELSNGCIDLNQIADLGIRFIICSCMLTFGGLCVFMQTKTVTEDLGLGWYFPGKCIQTGIGILLALIVSKWMMRSSLPALPFIAGAIICIATGVMIVTRKNSSIFKKCVV